MSAAAAPLHPDELCRLLRAAVPAALLVRPRLLRRVIKHDRKLTSIGLQVPHHKSYVIDRAPLLALADRAELGLEPDRELPATLLLIARPEPEDLAGRPRGDVLTEYWRLLFHASVHLAVRRRIVERRLSLAAIRARIHRIGPTEFREIRTVLRQEKYLLPPGDERTAYEEFAALYLELRYFAAPLLPSYFPAIERFPAIDRILAADVDGPALFAASRPAGAADPSVPVDLPTRAEEPELAPATEVRLPSSAAQCHELMSRADRAAAAGNVVRAAIRLAQAERLAPAELADMVRARARAELDRLVERLAAALHLAESERAPWRQALTALVPAAARGVWPAEARLLYDLQNVCVAHERPVSAPDFIRWVKSFFRAPLVRQLPSQALVRTLKQLRGAVGRLPSIRVSEAERHALSVLLHGALHHAEDRLRAHFRPLLRELWRAVGLEYQDLPEHVAHDKLIEELLDQVAEHGFLNLGQLRDALSRNQLKLPDLSGPRELLAGDPLLRANRALGEQAAGVYHRAEVYLRGLQRGSALVFGTRLGRWLTLFLALPLGGAYASIVFVQEMLHLVHLPLHLGHESLGIAIGLLGVFYLLLLHVPEARRLSARGFWAGWAALRAVLIDLPAAVLRWPPLRRLLESRPFLILVRYVAKPLPAAGLAGLALWISGLAAGAVTLGSAVALLISSLLLNSRLGRNLEEAVTDWAARRWDYCRDVIPGLVRLLIDFFKQSLEAIDRLLYTVDEWLRFRGGEGRLTRAAKMVLGLAWSVVAYVMRLYVIVFIEPTINPLKHFPAVTVAAKLLVPFWIPLTELFATPLMFLGAPLAYSIAFLGVHLLPGAAGFLVWELQANWRLYRANRWPTLRPVVVGSHGETLLRLLKPGFHSGTLPKLYAKLRRAERRAARRRSWHSPRRLREALVHVEESIRRFAERELVAFLCSCREPSGTTGWTAGLSRCREPSGTEAPEGPEAPLGSRGLLRGWTAGPVELALVETGSNQVRLELACPSLGTDNLELKFEEQSGWLLAGISRPGWLPALAAGQSAVLALALAGFYKKCGVDLVREQIEAAFAPACPPYDIAGEGLVVWPGAGYETEVVYDLRAGPVLQPCVVAGRLPADLPALDADRLLFSRQEVTWQDWVTAWERAGAPSKLIVPGLLPTMT